MDNKNKTWTYHKSHIAIINNDIKIKFGTQLYDIGVYAIINDDTDAQMSLTPKEMVKFEKQLKEQLDNHQIDSIEWGSEITVEETDAGYVEVKTDDDV